MKHTYNNWSRKIFEGFYESNLYNSDFLYCITKDNIDDFSFHTLGWTTEGQD